LEFPELIQRQRVLELGCGIGFLGIVTAILQNCQGELWLTDVNEEVLVKCMANVRLDCSEFEKTSMPQLDDCTAYILPTDSSSNHPAIHYKALDWSLALQEDTNQLQRLFRDEISPDIVIGADIVGKCAYYMLP
jgi:protein-lysine N-methyltransferase EEF2KMT